MPVDLTVPSKLVLSSLETTIQEMGWLLVLLLWNHTLVYLPWGRPGNSHSKSVVSRGLQALFLRAWLQLEVVTADEKATAAFSRLLACTCTWRQQRRWFCAHLWAEQCPDLGAGSNIQTLTNNNMVRYIFRRLHQTSCSQIAKDPPLSLLRLLTTCRHTHIVAMHAAINLLE